MDPISVIFFTFNGPISLCCIFINIFFMFCILSQKRGTAEVKQPLKILLLAVAMCSALLQALVFKYIFLSAQAWLSLAVFHVILKDLVEISMTTTVWLNVFYFSQIVPAQRAFSVWLKSNIKLVIYCCLLFDWVFLLSNGILEVFISSAKAQNTVNSTGNGTDPHEYSPHHVISLVSHVIELLYLFLSLLVMLGSGCATVNYLKRHMENMKSSMKSSLESQLRVTTTGIVQAVFYFLCAMWICISMLHNDIFKSNFDKDDYIFFSVTSFYSLGTCINLGIGQSLFRRKAADLWHKISKMIQSRRHV